MPLPTWDVFIGLIFIVGIAYGLILRREKTITTLCSTYIGLVIATSFSSYIFDFFNGNKVVANQIWIRSSASLSTVSIATLLLATFLVSGAINSTSSKAGDVSFFEVIVYSSLNIALILSAVLGFLPEEARAGYLEASRFARILFDLKTLWVVLPPIALVILNFRRK
ncbi:hypothetical protein A2215_03845 [Candidatus Berkelbacteria bacterium RIFOXYA2_FULL_43_10]|uniref:Colicin V production protein n=1 Tax=Candidatus Berkelbacteria bacterium RIFOXYA2_FULL_43_10 TaxID=1797472 RepID=A0A1F5E494_9BACT|nr:MAG: hypothetical protein A2215_03845 [Candidatus Berkelbacteria bacterium RIFOXYA2_FULL_43_10]